MEYLKANFAFQPCWIIFQPWSIKMSSDEFNCKCPLIFLVSFCFLNMRSYQTQWLAFWVFNRAKKEFLSTAVVCSVLWRTCPGGLKNHRLILLSSILFSWWQLSCHKIFLKVSGFCTRYLALYLCVLIANTRHAQLWSRSCKRESEPVVIFAEA